MPIITDTIFDPKDVTIDVDDTYTVTCDAGKTLSLTVTTTLDLIETSTTSAVTGGSVDLKCTSTGDLAPLASSYTCEGNDAKHM